MSDRLERRVSRALAAALTTLAVYYALLGGEYDLFDLRELRGVHARTIAGVDSLRARTDSLRAWADSLADVPLVIERVARERHSFIRPGERLFLFVDPGELEEGEEREGRGRRERGAKRAAGG